MVRRDGSKLFPMSGPQTATYDGIFFKLGLPIFHFIQYAVLLAL